MGAGRGADRAGAGRGGDDAVSIRGGGGGGGLAVGAEAGDELLLVDSCYEPTRVLARNILGPMGITTRFYDPLIGGGIADLFTDATRAVFMESPGSLTFEVQDVPAICAAARARGSLR